MYIVWKYDSFPYVLCGKTVGKKIDGCFYGRKTVNGCYEVEGYGKGRVFKPIKVIKSNIKGERLKQRLEELTDQRRTEMALMDKHYDGLIKYALGRAE